RPGKLVVALPGCLEFGLRFHHRLEPATACDAAVLPIPAGEFISALNSHRSTSCSDLGLECAPITAIIRVDVIEVAALRALAVEHVGNAPVGNIRVVPQRIGRTLSAVNLSDAHRVVGQYQKVSAAINCRVSRSIRLESYSGG